MADTIYATVYDPCINAWVVDPCIYGIITQFIINAPKGDKGDPGGISDASVTGYGLYWINGLLNTSLYSEYLREASINAYATNSSVGLAIKNFASNASVNTAFITNTSLGLVAVYDLGPYATNASVNLAFSSNASLGLVVIYDLTPYATNVSVGQALIPYATNSSVNLAFLTNASLGLVAVYNLAPYATNSSVNLTLQKYLKEASIGSGFSWNGTYLDVSAQGDVTKLYVDGSLAIRDASISEMYKDSVEGSLYFVTRTQFDASIVLKADKTYVDASLNVKTDFTYDVKQDTSIGLKADKTYVDASLNVKTDFTYDVKQDVSIGLKTDFTYDVKQDASINLKADKTYVDASLNIKTDFTYDVKQDVSINLKADLTYINSSLNFYLKNASLSDSKFKWNGAYLEPSISTGGGTLLSLTDVSIVSPILNQVLAYDTSLWKNKAAVNASVWDVVNASDYFWIFYDVSLTNPLNNQALVYDSTAKVFKNLTMSEASIYTVEDGSTYFQLKLNMGTKNSSANGYQGAWSFDASYLYICTSTNKWMRILGIENY